MMHTITLAPGEFFGEPAADSRHNGILCSVRRYPANTRLPLHSHEAPFFCLLVSGSYRERYRTREVTHLPSGLVFHPAGESHATEMGASGGSVFCIELGTTWMRMMSDYPAVSGTRIEAPGAPLSWLAQQVYQESGSGEPSGLVTESLICEMLSRATRADDKRSAPSWLPRAIQMLRDRSNSSITITETAREIGVHPFHLSRVFRYFQGMSVGDYVNRIRIDRAARILQEEMPVRLCELAIDVGFADQSHFTRTFRKLKGISPATYRRLAIPAKV